MSESSDRRVDAAGSQDLHPRNCDRLYGSDFALENRTVDGTTVVEQRYVLLPGQVETRCDVDPHGEYEIRAPLDNGRQKSLRCRIDSEAMHTAMTEGGNGGMRITAGFDD